MLSLLAYSLLLFGGPKVEADVTYAKVGDVELKMDIYHPDPKPEKPTGAVVVIHGGAWMAGKRQDMAQLCQEISKRGMLAATVQYRLAPKFKWPTMLDDVQTAVRYLRANASKYNVDPSRIGASGASAGGHLSLLLGSMETLDPKPEHFPGVSSKVSAVFNIFGPTDLLSDFPPSMDMLFNAVLGKPKAQAMDLVKQASPVTHITKLSAPVFTLHGSADPLVPVKQSKRLEDALKAVGVSVTTRTIEGMGHEVALSKPDCLKAMEEALGWLAGLLNSK
jgi:acetyl esterase/lipase